MTPALKQAFDTRDLWRARVLESEGYHAGSDARADLQRWLMGVGDPPPSLPVNLKRAQERVWKLMEEE
ncbi:MAG: hypothetical protein O2821_12715 [Chloroflexi bacterium]|nr:hypothetical protein [Chloroflexota bacterium]